MEDLLQFMFVATSIIGGAVVLFLILFFTDSTFRKEVIKDWKGE